jgi:hypothetical protein
MEVFGLVNDLEVDGDLISRDRGLEFGYELDECCLHGFE